MRFVAPAERGSLTPPESDLREGWGLGWVKYRNAAGEVVKLVAALA
ncbi:MAG: hypothetical protein NT025_01150 [bacterium]|nr:hypothetical protein [bacterium]